jgi:hypothetical protein
MPNVTMDALSPMPPVEHKTNHAALIAGESISLGR